MVVVYQQQERTANQGAQALQAVVQVARSGGIIAYPTEAVYGLGCDPGNAEALQRLLELKRRPASKGLILIAAEMAQLQAYIQPLDPAQTRKVMAHWPGPVTWLLPARADVSRYLRGCGDRIAVRLTAHTLTAQLCRQFGGALVSTSANRSGVAPCRTASCVRDVFGDQLDGLLDGELGGDPRPSRILDLASGTVLRD